MRIIAGRLGGRQFTSPKNTKTHPMSDKVRGAIFNSLGDISNLSVLDAFSGSGALSYEAASRGASSVVAVESDRNAIVAIKRNIQDLDLSRVIKPINVKVNVWLEASPPEKFDVILADPPYDNLSDSSIRSLLPRLTPNGILVLSWPPKQNNPKFENMQQIKTKNYGDSSLVFYRRVS